MALTPEQKAARQGKLTASSVGVLMGGDKEKIMALWQEMVGDPAFVEPDFEDIWAVQLGIVTEDLNLRWYERRSGRALSRRGEVVVHPDYDWAAATLDAFDEFLPGPVECKHVGGWEKTEVIVQRYMPQCQWQMEVTQTKTCALSLIEAAREPKIEVIEYDKDYANEMLARAHRFMRHVWEMTVPVEMEAVVAPVKPELLRDYNMTGNNTWAAHANDWLAHKKAAKLFADSEKGLKEMFPHDGRNAEGYGVKLSRDKAGRLRIRES